MKAAARCACWRCSRRPEGPVCRAPGPARHFYDPEKIAGKAIAAAVGGAGRVAWDVYLVYPPGARWDHDPPVPAEWRHQLGDSSWAAAAHSRTGEARLAGLRAGVSGAWPANRGSGEVGWRGGGF